MVLLSRGSKHRYQPLLKCLWSVMPLLESTKLKPMQHDCIINKNLQDNKKGDVVSEQNLKKLGGDCQL